MTNAINVAGFNSSLTLKPNIISFVLEAAAKIKIPIGFFNIRVQLLNQ